MEVIGDFQTTVRKALFEIDPEYDQLPGVVVCGTHAPHDIEEQMDKVWYARTNYIPFLGICWGHQLAFIEYCRNVLGIGDATSEELGGLGTYVVVKRPELKVGLHEGETWWSNFTTIEVEPPWDKNWNFFTVPFHPEYESSKKKPHPLLVKYIDACKKYIVVQPLH